MSARTSERGPLGKKTILIVDDHPVLRRGLATLIESEPDLAVCGEAATYQAALEAIREHRPDLVVVDLAIEGRDGLDLVKELKVLHPEVPALVLSMYDESVYAERCLKAGAHGYVTKQELDTTVLVAIHRVLDGERYMSNKVESLLAAKFISGQALDTDSPLDALSDRELQVFRLIGQGRTTRQIAETLTLSVKTIESHIEHIKQKLALESAAELAQRATQWVETNRIA
jgi:DNA-binding NarL/FixJ family response regulator